MIPIYNVHISPEVAYSADAVEVLRALKEAQVHDLELVAIYHSHPNSRAIPSESDQAQAFWRVPYVIVAMKDLETRAWSLPELHEIPIVVE